jgi:hypothetical protein
MLTRHARQHTCQLVLHHSMCQLPAEGPGCSRASGMLVVLLLMVSRSRLSCMQACRQVAPASLLLDLLIQPSDTLSWCMSCGFEVY